MSEHMTRYSAENLLEQLEGKGFAVGQEVRDFLVDQQLEKELPLYLRVIVGIGAFIASLFFIGFLVVAQLIDFDHGHAVIIWGLLFVASAIGLQKAAGHDDTIRHSFIMQSSFAAMAIGKTLFITGLAEVFDSIWGLTLGLLIVTALTYHIYRMSIDRFLSSFAALFMILVCILWTRSFGISRELLLNGLFLLQFFGAAILLTHGRIKRDYIPLSYAFALSLCASALFLASYTEFGYWNDEELIRPTFVNLVLTVGLIALFGWAAGGMEKLKTAPLLLASAGAVGLGFVSAPGILLTIGLMVLGYARHEKLLIIAGALLLPVFLWLYYYNLDISLLNKSGILVGSGIILLAGKFYLGYKGWDKEVAACAQK